MFKKYKTGKPDIDNEIDKIARKFSSPYTREHIHDLFTTVVKLHLDNADDHDLYLANVTLKEIRHISRFFAKYRDNRKVVVFGSHCIPQKSLDYKMAEEFSKKVAEKGFMVMTGGGGGIMEASNKGAGKKGFAVKIKLPAEFEPNKYIPKEKIVHVKYFYTRKLAFIKETDATVLFPGGFGTHDEGFEVLTLLQTGKCVPRPVVFVESKGSTYWKSWLEFLRKGPIKSKCLREQDLNMFRIVHSVKEAVAEVVSFYKVYHSIRYAWGKTVIRLNQRISDKKLKLLNKKFKDILLSGEIKPSGPLPVEVREKDHVHLPRLVMNFNRKSYGRLVELIRDLNAFVI